MMNKTDERALQPEDITRLFVERANARDAAGLAELYEPDAVLAFPPGRQTVGRDAIRAVYEQMVKQAPRFEPEPPLQSITAGDLSLTSTRRKDGKGIRIQVARRQDDGSWLRGIDVPE